MQIQVCIPAETENAFSCLLMQFQEMIQLAQIQFWRFSGQKWT